MKAKYLVTLLLVGLFAVGFPTGVLAGEGYDEAWEINESLDTGALVSADEGIYNNDTTFYQSDEIAVLEDSGEFDDHGG